MKSLGVIETRGLTSAIQAADAACKAASVEIVGYRKIGSGLVSVCFQGEISAVRTAVDHGIEVIANSQLLVGSLVIARPEESVISKLLTVKSKKGELEKSIQPEVKAEKLVEKVVVETKTEAPVAEVKTDINAKDVKNDPRKGKKS
ncbi:MULTISPECIES: BMC domain-containing protein [Providencia]|uniref:Carbon dioxide-concentrating mechanism protein CcmK homolog 2 n=1 Tax=Providencia rettgeri TaxID=587 RepID=A0A2U9L5R9_PRORE|nr:MULTISPECIES: BMC domain-containing protein [Providencia]EKT58973.1 propanediol utilization protein [Providencia rettgeri Dmel1]AWS50440.1 BMC domain-containing protein [Providencia rettgeri]EHZ7765215.1 BMC domain-containing protein [Providencia rettgeri]EIJ7168357.1 BMC domain-containing protein [Providencia rettgeri]EJD6049245.1 BMC domain-containing protein [Providencia rettgeri]